jgi:Ca2+-binding RTX toxin-like protein
VLAGTGNDRVSGGSGNDTIDGGDGNDRLSGNSGNDVILDGAGNDRIDGGSGNDLIIAGNGRDYYDGGSGFDTIDFSAASEALDINLDRNKATGSSEDTLRNIESIIGSHYDDVITGSSKEDVLIGGDGDDIIRSLEGSDILTGGEGNDTFVFEIDDVLRGHRSLGIDRITDFAEGDILDLSNFSGRNLTESIQDNIHLVEREGDTVVSVDYRGSYIDVVTLDDVIGLSTVDMYADGFLIF